MSRFLVLILLFVSLQARAEDHIDLEPCLERLNTVQRENQSYIWPAGPLEKTQTSSPSKYSSINSDLFRVSSVVKGLHGGERLVLRRSIAWHDGRRNANEDMASITQDLRLPPALLGRLEARFFGFQQISSKEMVVPTVEEINKAIAEFNSGLSKDDLRFIKIKFYESNKPIETSEDYVRRFAESSEIPISMMGRSYTHDISAHVLENIFAPNEYFEIFQSRARLWLDFVDSVKRYHSDDTRGFLNWNQRIMDALSFQIDQLGMSSGNFVDPTSRITINQVGLNLTRESDAYKYGDPTAHSPQIERPSFIITGLIEDNVPGLILSAWDFLKPRPPIDVVSAEYSKILKTFLQNQAKIYPERFKTLSFDLSAQAAELNVILRNTVGYKNREAAMANLPISAPYVGRLRRVREIILESPDRYR